MICASNALEVLMLLRSRFYKIVMELSAIFFCNVDFDLNHMHKLIKCVSAPRSFVFSVVLCPVPDARLTRKSIRDFLSFVVWCLLVNRQWSSSPVVLSPSRVLEQPLVCS